MHTVEVNGIELQYLDEGKGKGLVLLHGLGSSHKDWDLLIPVLSSKFRVIAPDLRAHGASTRVPKEQSVEHMAQDVLDLMDHLDLEKASLVGFSMGGAVAFELAASHGQRVEKLVIINSGPNFNAPQESGVDLLEQRTKIIEEKGFKFLAESIAKGMYPLEEQEDLREEFEKRILSNDEKAYLQTFGKLMNWGLNERIEKVTHPTLVVASDGDYTPVGYKKAYSEELRDAQLVVIENSRHGVVSDQSEKLTEELLKFL